MPFPETLKLSVRRRAHFRCCICRAVGVEVHHIVPEESNGPDTERNAAPLCPTCHELLGANSTKQKFIREARDFWYEFCDKQQEHSGLTADDLRTALEPIASKNDILELKTLISKILNPKSPQKLRSLANEARLVPLERFIQSLYAEEFKETRDMFDIFFDSRSWYEPGEDSYDLVDSRAAFLNLFGEQTARRVCLTACKDVGFSHDGFTEEDFGKALHTIHIMVILIIGHEKFVKQGEAYQCLQTADGEFVWQVVQVRKPRPNKRTKARSISTRKGKRV